MKYDYVLFEDTCEELEGLVPNVKQMARQLTRERKGKDYGKKNKRHEAEVLSEQC